MKKHARYEERVRAVKSIKDQGLPIDVVAKAYGRHIATIYRWIELYEKHNSYKALKTKHRTGAPCLILKKEAKKIRKRFRKACFKV